MSTEIRVPQLGESIVEATIGRWLKQAGDSVKADEPVVELETDKVNVEVPSSVAGVLSEILRPVGDVVGINDVLATVSTEGAAASAAPIAAPVPPAESSPAPEESKPHATPVADRIAGANGIDLAQVKGSGAGGKVLKQDVEAVLSKPAAPVAVPAPAPSAAPLSAPVAKPEDNRIERRPMSRRRRVIAANLVRAQQTAAMLTTFNEADMSAVMEIRKRRRDAFKEKHGVGLGFMSFFTKAVVGALKQFPLLNAEIEGDDVLVKHYYDIGIAVGAAEGLVVPVIRDADRKTFAEIERTVVDLGTRARENKLTISDLQGATFSVTNGGIFGSLMSTPILNYPQVGILGMHKIQERPIVVNGEIAIRPMMYLALSYDHRIVDGREAVSFLVAVKDLIEDPERLLLEG